MIKSIKHWLLTVLVLVMVLTVVPFRSFAATNTLEFSDGSQFNSSSMTFKASGKNTQEKTVTITNRYENPVKVSFNYTVSLSEIDLSVLGHVMGEYSINDVDTKDEVSCTVTLQPNASFSIYVKSVSSPWASRTTSVTLTNIDVEQIYTSAQVTLKYDSAIGTVKQGGNVLANDATFESTKDNPVVLTAEGDFIAWVDENNKVLSRERSYPVVPIASSMTVRALFSDGTPWFYVNGNTYIVQGLDNALKSYTGNIVLANNATLPAGDYTIPNNVTLVIPYDVHGTTSVDKPASVTPLSLSEAMPNYPIPAAYRTLTMAEGANIVVEGTLSVPAKIYQGASGQPSGMPCDTYGHIHMNAGSTITVKSNANLSAYGYITGSGTVLAKNGAKVYQTFQISDFRGGSCTFDMNGGMGGILNGGNDYDVFPLHEYYVQNVEAPVTYESGAKLYCYVALNMSSELVDSTVEFIGGSNALFNLSSGSMIMQYDRANDRMKVDVNGDVALNGINITVKVVVSASINSSNYVLPINNMEVNIHSGTVSMNSDLCILPGCKVNIESGATMKLAKNVRFYIYDRDQWIRDAVVAGGTDGSTTGGFCYYYGALTNIAPLYYAPDRVYTRTEADRTDAAITVAGTLDASQGYMYTTAGGANINGVEGGVVKVKPGTETNTYQATQGGEKGTTPYYHAIPITPAQLKNADDTYVSTAKAATTMKYVNGAWTCQHSNLKTLEAVAPTCTATGLTEGKQCAFCGEITLAQETVPAKGHTAGAEATCTTAQTCTVCGTELEKAKGHKPGAEATCTTAQTCTACGTELKAALGHKPGAEATCTTAQTCTACGEVLVKALDHSYGTVVTAPTCTAGGYTTYTCIRGDHTYTADETEATGHDYKVTDSTNPTCTEAGSTIYACECGDFYTEPTAALGHKYDATVTKPTCTEGGYTTYVCSVCSDTYKDNETDKAGHTAGAAVKEKEYTGINTESYDLVVKCSVCSHEMSRTSVTKEIKNGEFKDEAIPQAVKDVLPEITSAEALKNHMIAAVINDAPEGTKVENSKLYDVVLYKNDSAAGNEDFPEDGVLTVHLPVPEGTDIFRFTFYVAHMFTSDRFGKTPGHIEYPEIENKYVHDGVGYIQFKVTGLSPIAVGYAMTDACGLGHTNIVIDEAVEATCIKDGMTKGSHCETCGTVIEEQKVVTTQGHTEDKVVTAPTCTSAGYTTYTCSICGATRTADETEKLTHSEEAEVTAPTCTSDGYTTYTCSVCGAIRIGDKVANQGHSYDEGTVTNPTCTTAGYTTYTCGTCGHSYHDNEVAGGHTAGAAVVENNVAPDCVNAGSYDNVIYCTVCGEETSREAVTVPALNHTAGETVVENEVAATCTTAGSYDNVIYCTVCTAEISRTPCTVPVKDHTDGDAVVENNVAADCVNAGSYDSVTYCTVCGEETSRETITTDALGHTEETVTGSAATCTTPGKTDGVKCSVCQEVLVAQEDIEVLGHNAGAAATCTTAQTCNTCGAKLQEALGHDWDSYEYTWNEDHTVCTATRVCKTDTTHNETATSISVETNETQKLTCEQDGITVYTATFAADSQAEPQTKTVTVTANGSHTEGDPVEENRKPSTTLVKGGYDSVVYCSACSTELSRQHFELALAKDPFLGTNMTLQDSLALNFAISVNDMNAGFTATITRTYGNGKAPHEYPLTGDDWTWLSKEKGQVKISYHGLAAKEMCDQITLTIYNAEGDVYAVKTDSAQAYCQRMVDKYTSTKDYNETKAALYVDLLNYGTAAQIKFKYCHTDPNMWANAGVTAEQQKFATADIAAEDIENVKTDGTAANLSLENTISLNIAVKQSMNSDAAYAIVTYTGHTGTAYEKRIERADFEVNNTYWVFTGPGLAIADGKTAVTVEIYNSNGDVISTNVDSIESYCGRMRKTDAQWDVCDMLLKLTRSAYQNFHS